MTQPMTHFSNAIAISASAAIAFIAASTLASAAVVALLSVASPADAKTFNDDAAKTPVVERIERGFTPSADIDRGWSPDEMVTARGFTPEQDAERGFSRKMDVARGFTPERDAERGFAPETNVARGASPAQFQVARGYTQSRAA